METIANNIATLIAIITLAVACFGGVVWLVRGMGGVERDE